MTPGRAVVAPDADHGGRVHQAARLLGCEPADLLDLSASLNPFAPPVESVVVEAVATLRHYPDAAPATHRLAAAIGAPVERVVLTNGAAEAIALVAGVMPVGDVVEPEFSLYRRHLRAVRPGGARWRSNPSNPLGCLAGRSEHATVWDESFYPLATGVWSRGDDGWRIGSLTKLWACPGLRLGFVVAPDATAADHLRATQPEWSVNSLALAAVGPMLDRTDLAGWSQAIAAARSDLVSVLAQYGLDVRATDANWVLVDDVPSGLVDGLFANRVLVRDCANFGLPGTVRIAVPNGDDLARLDRALAALPGRGA
jgi:histidinol-phosphate/aromatic aminotransferase/cobyric acid decarboxylase-like protein